MVTNTYLHTNGPASLRLTALADGRLRVGVWDSHHRVPAPFGRPPTTMSRSPRRTTTAVAACASYRNTPTAGAACPSATASWTVAPGSCSGSRRASERGTLRIRT